MKRPLVILTGPTAVGKTKASIGLAKEIGGEIISADSMQVYRHMDIGSAKITASEMQGIKHHLIDVLSPEEEFHVAKFQELAKKAAEEIYLAGHIPIVAGGTGFYIQALLYDIDFSKGDENKEYREEMMQAALVKGPEYVHGLLKKADPKSADTIHPNNVKRVVRALEYYHQTGERISVHNETQQKRTSPYQSAYFVLNDERSHLYERIDRRVDQMLDYGLVEEVKALKTMGYTRELVSMQGLGYKEILAYLEGECTLEEAVYTIKRDTRHFAKRQITWFKRERDVIWLNKQDYGYDEEKLLQEMLRVLRERNIISC